VVTNHDLWGEGFQRRVIGNTLAHIAAGDETRLPPDAAFPAGEDPALGAWTLPDGGRIEIVDRDGRMQLRARGQSAIELFEPDESLGARADATRRAQLVLAAAAAGDTAAAATILGPAELHPAFDFLAQGLARLRARYGAIDSVETLGSVTSPFVFQGTRAFYLVHVRAGTRGGFLAFRDGRLDDVTLGDDRPAPLILPVAPLAGGGYATFDLLRSRAEGFRIEGDSLIAGEAVATRIPR
jgi:hypothetical protein